MKEHVSIMELVHEALTKEILEQIVPRGQNVSVVSVQMANVLE
jgi:hypothetical protein